MVKYLFSCTGCLTQHSVPLKTSAKTKANLDKTVKSPSLTICKRRAESY